MIIRILRLIPDDTKLDFWGHRLYAYAMTGLVIFGSIFLLATKGLNFGIDFTGGTVIEVQVPVDPDLAKMREDLNALNLGEISIQEFGEARDLLIRMPQQDGGPDEQQAAIAKVNDTVSASFKGQGDVDFRRTEFVGPQVGEELKKDGLIAVVLAIVSIAGYIWFRFEWQYGLSATVALFHDMIGVLGLFSLTQMQFDLSTLAAVLLVGGYSINDTVIIFDRIRENLRKYKKMALPDVINMSVNQTLARTLMTSGTTLMALFALWFFGGEVIRAFVNALFFGIAIGTHSSIFVAAPLLVYMKLRPDNGRAGTAESAEGEGQAA
jgi:preprotein translocase SecF subunit